MEEVASVGRELSYTEESSPGSISTKQSRAARKNQVYTTGLINSPSAESARTRERGILDYPRVGTDGTFSRNDDQSERIANDVAPSNNRDAFAYRRV